MATTIVPKEKKRKREQDSVLYLSTAIPKALKIRLDVVVAKSPGLKMKDFVATALEKEVALAERRLERGSAA